MRKQTLSGFIFLLIVGLMSGCQTLPEHWPANGTVLKAVTYHLPLADSSRILLAQDGYVTLTAFADSLRTEVDSIYYRAPGATPFKELLGRIDQEAVRTSDSGAVEYYRFNNGNVYLAGLVTGDTTKPLLLFDPPLLFMPANDATTNAGESHLKTWRQTAANDEPGLKTHIAFCKKRDLTLRTGDGALRQCMLLEMLFTQDAAVAYGAHNLVVPEALVIKQTMLIDTDNGIIAEWSVKARPADNNAELSQPAAPALYIELTNYHLTT